MSEKRDTRIVARIDHELKEKGEEILRQMGVTTTEVVTMLFSQIVIQRRIPFPITADRIIVDDEATETKDNYRDKPERKKTKMSSTQKEDTNDDDEDDHQFDSFFGRPTAF